MPTSDIKNLFKNKRKKYQLSFYKKGIILGFKRSLRHQDLSKARIQVLEFNCKNVKESFVGKKIFFIIKYKNKKRKLNWGKIISKHGNNGIFIAKFKKNLCPSLISSPIYITLLPYKI